MILEITLSNENVNSSQDDPIIKEISVPHPKIKKILQNQINSLKHFLTL